MSARFPLWTLSLLLGACSFTNPDKTVELTPNWQVTEARVTDNYWRIQMRKKAFTTGGDGEAVELLHRHAAKLAELHGYRSYRITAWAEGVQSDVPIAHRWARGEIELREYLPPMPEG